MILETEKIETKSLRIIEKGKERSGYSSIAKACVGFANAAGGTLLIGIGDKEDQPPPGQSIPDEKLALLRRRITELTSNVTVRAEKALSENGGEFVRISVDRSQGIASTADGQYFIRIGDATKPVVGDEVMRLMEDKPQAPWETKTELGVSHNQTDRKKQKMFVDKIRGSSRVKPSVKEKTAAELLAHYQLASEGKLTNLGILCVGKQFDRARLGVSPTIQFLKFDERGEKVNKIVWDDHALSPAELVDEVWRDIPDFRESYEVKEGLFAFELSVFDEKLIRELVVNALVHRSYWQSGDILLHLHPDRLEVVSPGRLPLGVTPKNILHASRRRNTGLARVFHDIGLMEREGSGFDEIYDLLLSQGRTEPKVEEANDRVKVTVARAAPEARILRFIKKASEHYGLSTRDRIVLGILAKHEAMKARELADKLELESDTAGLGDWLKNLQACELVGKRGRTKGAQYFVKPEILRKLDFPSQTTLTRIEAPRLHALILEDLRRYPKSSIGDIRKRIGAEIPRARVQGALRKLVAEGEVKKEGQRKGTKYS